MQKKICLHIIFSSILYIDGSTLIGLELFLFVLSSFLKIGDTFTIFICMGKSFDVMDLLKIFATGSLIVYIADFRI